MAFGTLYGPANYNNYRRCTILLFCFYFSQTHHKVENFDFFFFGFWIFVFCSSGVAYIYWFHYDDGGKKKWESFFLVTSTNGSFFNSSSLFLFISFVYFLSLFFFYLISLFVCLFSLSLCLYDRTKLSGVLVLVRDLRQRCWWYGSVCFNSTRVRGREVELFQEENQEEEERGTQKKSYFSVV